jgi:hypothetical protein
MAQYVCEFCNHPIIDLGVGTHHYVKAWVKTGVNSNPRHIEKLFLYAHSICVETSKTALPKATQDVGLFD